MRDVIPAHQHFHIQILLLKCLVCYFQYSNFRRTEGGGNCCLWQGRGTQRKECSMMHSSCTAEADEEKPLWVWEKNPFVSHRLGVAEEEREWLAHSYAPLLSAHEARLAWGHKKYNSFFHTLAFQLPWNQNSGQTPGAEERRNIGLTVTYASESWGSQLLLCVLYLTRSCQDNIEKQYLYQGSEFFGFFFSF